MTGSGSIAPAPAQGSAARRVVTGLLGRLRHGTLAIQEGADVREFGEDDGSGTRASMVIRNPSFWRSVLLRGGLGLGEAYFEGAWESDDPVAVLRLLARNLDDLNRVSAPFNSAWRRVSAPARWLRRPSKAVDRRNVGAHYDLGNEFFELFLDPSMAYSCGIFETPLTSLHDASLAKFERIGAKLELGPSDHVLEIGGGWGGFALYAAQHWGCRVTTTTISERQYEYATRLVAEAGAGDRVTVLNQDYRELSGTYSNLVSIEMIEAVDWRDLGTFFATCERLLRPDGRVALQTIVIADSEYERYKTSMDFIRRYIFPGGSLPSISSLTRTITQSSDLRVTSLEDIGHHYARTLREWRANLHRGWDAARRLGYSERFLRMWDFYFAYCEAGFLERRVSDVQVVLAGPDWRAAQAPVTTARAQP